MFARLIVGITEPFSRHHYQNDHLNLSKWQLNLIEDVLYKSLLHLENIQKIDLACPNLNSINYGWYT